MVMGSMPVVAAVEGFCVGAGLSLACASDTVVAAEDARFAAGFGKIGLMADLGLPHTLPMRVGQGRARQILFYHGQMSAPEARAHRHRRSCRAEGPCAGDRAGEGASSSPSRPPRRWR